MTIWGFE